MEFTPDDTIKLSLLGSKWTFFTGNDKLHISKFARGLPAGKVVVAMWHLRLMPGALNVLRAAKDFLKSQTQVYSIAEDRRYRLELNGRFLMVEEKAWESPQERYPGRSVVIDLTTAWDKRSELVELLGVLINYLERAA